MIRVYYGYVVPSGRKIDRKAKHSALKIHAHGLHSASVSHWVVYGYVLRYYG